jgi:hypothetical protein
MWKDFLPPIWALIIEVPFVESSPDKKYCSPIALVGKWLDLLLGSIEDRRS